MLDAYDCDLEQANSFMAVNNLLVSLTHELGMRPVMPPFVLPNSSPAWIKILP